MEKNIELSISLKNKYNLKEKDCYLNAQEIMSKENFDRVLGYVVKKNDKGIALRHSWNLDKEGNIIDGTLGNLMQDHNYYEAYRLTYKQFLSEKIIDKCEGLDLRGLNIELEEECIYDNDLVCLDKEIDYFIYEIEVLNH